MKKNIKKIIDFTKKHTLISFLGALLVLFIIIFIGNKIRSVDEVITEKTSVAKEVSVVTAGNSQYTTVSGKVEKDGIITIVSQVSGIVHNVYAKEGKDVYKGNRIAYIADTYGGGNVASMTNNIAARQAQTQQETFEKRMGIIDDSRDDVRKTNDLEAEIARKQYTLQKRNTELERDLAVLQSKQSAINAARYIPTTPIAGTIERVFVSQGDTINPGDKIAVVNAKDKKLNITVQVSDALASVIDIDSPSVLYIDDEKVTVLPHYLSQSATDNQSYVITYVLDEKYMNTVTNDAFIEISIPINTQISTEESLVPLDAVHLMSDKNIIFIIEDNKVVAREVSIGNVIGSFIAVHSNIKPEDVIVLNRNVFEGDLVSVIK